MPFTSTQANTARGALRDLETLLKHAGETYPHFESERGQSDIGAASGALNTLRDLMGLPRVICPITPDALGLGLVGCGSSAVEGPDDEGLYDCLDCGLWFSLQEAS